MSAWVLKTIVDIPWLCHMQPIAMTEDTRVSPLTLVAASISSRALPFGLQVSLVRSQALGPRSSLLMIVRHRKRVLLGTT